MTIGERIQQKMKEKGLRQNELARRAGISSSGMSTIIHGNFEPRMDNLRQIAQVLGCQVSDLIEDETKKEQEAQADPLRESVIRDYDRLSPDARRLVRQYIDLLRASPPPEAARPNTPADAADPPD